MNIREICHNDLKEFRIETGNTLKAIREEKGLTVSQVARKIQKPYDFISSIESGKCNSMKRIVWLAYVYDKKAKVVFY